MRAIGFRAEKTVVHVATVDDSSDPPHCSFQKFAIDAKKPTAEELTHLRVAVVNAIDTFHPDCVGVRTSDQPKVMRYFQSYLDRARVEGVIMEAAASKGLTVTAGPATTIKSGMGTKHSLKKYANLDKVREIDLSGHKNESDREAVYAALAAIGRKKG